MAKGALQGLLEAAKRGHSTEEPKGKDGEGNERRGVELESPLPISVSKPAEASGHTAFLKALLLLGQIKL